MKMNRRTFAYAIGSVTAAIAGWVLIPRSDQPSPEQPSPAPVDGEFRPTLAQDVTFQTTSAGVEISRLDEQGQPHVVCQVNESGLKVLERMDGERTLQQLAVAMHGASDPASLGHTEASVALFVATLAQGGLLSEPFFVNLHSVEVSA